MRGHSITLLIDGGNCFHHHFAQCLFGSGRTCACRFSNLEHQLVQKLIRRFFCRGQAIFLYVHIPDLFDANVDKIQFPNKFSAIKFTAFQYFPDLRAFAGRWGYSTGSK